MATTFCKWILTHQESHLKWPESWTFEFATLKGVKYALQNGITLVVLDFWKYIVPPLLCNSDFSPFSMCNLHQIWNPPTVFKSARHEDSKTPPTCSIWWRSGDTVTKTDAVPVDRVVNDDWRYCYQSRRFTSWWDSQWSIGVTNCQNLEMIPSN